MPRDPVALVVERLAWSGRLTQASGFDVRLAPYETDVRVAGTGGVVVAVVPTPGGWGAGGVATWRQPRVTVNVYADVSRDEFGSSVADDAAERALTVWSLIDPELHPVTHSTWADVVSCRRSGEPEVIPVPNGDGAVLLSTLYELALL